MTGRPAWVARAVTAAAAVTLLGLGVVAGLVLRPVLIDTQPSAAPALTTVETGFLADMAAHHQQALAMATVIDRPGVDDSIRALARQIRFTQGGELGTLVGWLQLSDRPIANPRPMAWMTRYAGTGGAHHDPAPGAHQMPGMATADEVAALGTLPPEEAETSFLQLMQRHHYGGIAMAQDLTAQVSDGLVAQLATSMISSQSKETGLMGAMLIERGAAS